MKESIRKFQQKIKSLLDSFSRKNNLFIVLFFITMSAASFGLERLSALEEQGGTVKIENGKGAIYGEPAAGIGFVDEAERPPGKAQDTVPAISGGGQYVASKNGGKYHLPWCAGALRIKEENKVWFPTKEDAERAGYTPAENCKGL